MARVNVTERLSCLEEGEGTVVLSARLSADYTLEEGIFKVLQLEYRNKLSDQYIIGEFNDVSVDEIGEVIRDFVFEAQS